MNVQKALEGEQNKEKLKNLKIEMLEKENESNENMTRVESNLKFSQDANRNLKNDYDALMDKFDKHMKATNNLNMDLKDEIELLSIEIGKLRLYKDDQEEMGKTHREKLENSIKDKLTEKDTQIEHE